MIDTRQVEQKLAIIFQAADRLRAARAQAVQVTSLSVLGAAAEDLAKEIEHLLAPWNRSSR